MSDFSNYSIEPKFSTINSRSEVDISTYIGDFHVQVPVISANMQCLTGPMMCRAMYQAGGLGCLHRFFPVEETIKMHESIGVPYIASIGIKPQEYERYKLFRKAGQKHFCIDVAHGAQQQVYEFLREIRNAESENIWIMVGNFGSYLERAVPIYELADAIKVGIGPGEVCTTRKVTGVGVSQVDALYSYSGDEEQTYEICCDGGMRHPGDVAKALILGAHYVMTGSLLKGAHESEDPYLYSGSASAISYTMQNKSQTYIAPEGISKSIDAPKRSVRQIMNEIAGGLRSALAYTNSRNLEEFYDSEIVGH